MTDVPDQVSDPSPSLPPASHCANCGSPLSGHYCGVCGQRNREIRRPVYSLLRELFHVLLDLDGRAYRTVGLLLTRPAYLSKAYVNGQRMRYTPPLRLFIAVSILFFVVVTIGTSLTSLRNAMLEMQQEPAAVTGNADQQPPVDVSLEPQAEPQADSGTEPASGSEPEPQAEPDVGERFLSGEIDDEDLQQFDALIELIRIPLLSEESNASLHAVMRNQARENYRNLIADPGGTIIGLVEYITVFLLVMMPILALIQYVFFFPARRYYIEHLILVLHNNAFVVAILLLNTLLDVVVTAEIPLLSGAVSALADIASIWMPIYLFLSLKFFFNWGWLLTSLLFLLVSISYVITTVVGMLLFVIILFLLF